MDEQADGNTGPEEEANTEEDEGTKEEEMQVRRSLTEAIVLGVVTIALLGKQT